MKILVTGANGLLGQHLVKQLLQSNYSVIASGRGNSRLPFPEGENYKYITADLTNGQEITDLLYNERPQVIVHAGAITQVDNCQQNQDACFDVNVKATAELLVAAEQFAELFIFISTDFIFDGVKGYYKEEDPINPISWYGFTKVQAESTVETSEIPWAIVRTCLVYGNTFDGTRNNIISWVKDNLQAGKEIKVVNDQYRMPTYVEDLAKGIILIIRKKATGVFHLSGKDMLSPYDMAMATAGYYQLNRELIKKVDASTFSQPAKRPPKTGFDITKARNVLGYEPVSFLNGLKLMDND